MPETGRNDRKIKNPLLPRISRSIWQSQSNIGVPRHPKSDGIAHFRTLFWSVPAVSFTAVKERGIRLTTCIDLPEHSETNSELAVRPNPSFPRKRESIGSNRDSGRRYGYTPILRKVRGPLATGPAIRVRGIPVEQWDVPNGVWFLTVPAPVSSDSVCPRGYRKSWTSA